MSDLIEAFFGTLYRPALRNSDLVDACVTLWTLPSKLSIHCPLRDLSALAQQAAEADARGSDVYFGVALRKPGLYPGARGKKEDLFAATTLWVDIDIKGAAHAAHNLPETEEDALSLITELGSLADQVVHSGNGLHVYWYLDTPFFLRTPQEVEAFEKMNIPLQRKVRDLAAVKGWHVDMTANADRVLRVPGTNNRKVTSTIELVPDVTS